MEIYRFLSNWLGQGLLLATGDRWRRHRKIITPAFHFKILEQFIEVFNDKGKILINILKSKTDKVININPFVTLYALDVISETAMGVSINAQKDAKSDYVRAVYKMCEIIRNRSDSLLKQNDTLYKYTQDYKNEQESVKTLHEFTEKIIKSRKVLMKDQIDRRMKETAIDLSEDATMGIQKKVAFLDLLLLSKTQEGHPVPDELIREEVDTFMFEGHDTTSAAISFALYALANSPDAQEKAFNEQKNIMGNDPNTEPTYQNLQDMKYMELVLRETLRLYPSVPIYGRMLDKDLTLKGDVKIAVLNYFKKDCLEAKDGRVIPAKSNIALFVLGMGKNPKYFDDPDKFYPERFLPENMKFKHPYLSVPFSAGPRNCIGQKFAILELKSILSKILRSFELSSSGVELILMNEVILKSRNGVQIKLKTRVY